MAEVTLDVPDDMLVALKLTPERFGDEVRLAAAVKLLELGRLSTGAAAPVAYRMLGSLGEVDDAVQEAWLRLSRSDTSAVENLRGWRTTVVARVCLDMLRSRRARREEPEVAHLPDPIVTRDDGSYPEHEVLLG